MILFSILGLYILSVILSWGWMYAYMQGRFRSIADIQLISDYLVTFVMSLFGPVTVLICLFEGLEYGWKIIPYKRGQVRVGVRLRDLNLIRKWKEYKAEQKRVSEYWSGNNKETEVWEVLDDSEEMEYLNRLGVNDDKAEVDRSWGELH